MLKQKNVLFISITLCIILSACSKQSDFDAKSYVQSSLDAYYHGEYADYANFLEISEKDAKKEIEEDFNERIMIYMYGLQELGLVGQVIAGLFAVGGCLRLARFNCNTGVVHGYFQGMPIPAGACFLATYVLSGYHFAPAVLAVVTLVVACIMYSEVRFPDFKGKGNPMYRIPVVIALVIGAAMLYERPSAWMFVAMFTYTIAGIINHVYRAVTGKNK